MSRRALLSVSDKSGIVELGRALVDREIQLLSTGGTARVLREAGLPVTEVSDITGHPEIMDGRVKTLHPAIHGPLLARRDVPADLEALADHGYRSIDLVVVNLYPFRETVASGDVSVADAMEKVDIGGPTMIRAAAKNHAHLWVVVDPEDYSRVVQAMDGVQEDSLELRRELAAKVFRHVSDYDAAVAAFLAQKGEEGEASEPSAARSTEDQDPLPSVLHRSWTRSAVLRYGENPDQAGALYAVDGAAPGGISALEQHHGKALSYNNLLDLDGALLSLTPFALSPRPAVVIVKHTTPCGLGIGDTVADAYRKALASDPVSAFGSIIATNRAVDGEAGRLISELFVECVVAPAFTEEALEILTRKKNLRILTLPGGGEGKGEAWEAGSGIASLPKAVQEAIQAHREPGTAAFLAGHGRAPDPVVLRGIYGGLLAQTAPLPPFYGIEDTEWKVVTRREPTAEEQDDLAFAWGAVFGVKSNAILLARGGATLGIGAGQMSRVDASRLAVQKAADGGHELQGAALASDAFFPFRDGVDAAAEAGIRTIIQPGGSIRDDEVIESADEHGIAMIFTGRRLFRH
jgi:phosphoribosylaminoimidazolecarboxamide formyltransferase / IMP cyclohydrolase